MDNTPASVERRIQAAYHMVKRLGIGEPDLQREAFVYAMAALGSPQPATPAAGQGDSAEAASLHGRIAQGLDVPLELIELLYDLHGGELTLNVPAKLLPDSRSAAMREIGVLLAVGRKHAGLGASTPYETIRAASEELGKLDKKNFAAAMAGMKPRLSTSGKGLARDLVPKRPADDWAREIIGRYGQFVG